MSATATAVTLAVVREIVGAAAAAPSVHNTQPWSFRWSDASKTIELHGDLSRQLTAQDPDGRALVMSRSAYDSLTPYQVERMSNYCELVPMSIRTIETIGGGSARCMMAEVFLPEKGR